MTERAAFRALLRQRCADVSIAGRIIGAARLAVYRWAQCAADLAESEVLIVRRHGHAAGALAARPLAWDTAIFGRRMGALRWIVTAGQIADARGVAAALLDRALQWRRQRRIAHLVARIEPDQLPIAQQLEGAGFQLMDVLLTLQCVRAPSAPALPRGYTLRPATPADRTAVARIAARVFTVSRYRYDRTLDQRAVDRLYARWAGDAVAGQADHVVVASRAGRVVGFATCLITRDPRPPMAAATLDLIGVDPAHQGRGLGGALIAAAVRWGLARATVVELRTQAVNAAALAAYQRAGFALAPAGLVAPGGLTFHRSWL